MRLGARSGGFPVLLVSEERARRVLKQNGENLRFRQIQEYDSAAVVCSGCEAQKEPEKAPVVEGRQGSRLGRLVAARRDR